MEAIAHLTPGTFPQWGTFAGVLALVAGGIVAFIKGMPERTRADTEANKVRGEQYAEQIKDFRDEVHGYRNDLHIMQIRLTKAESASRLRADRITNMTFIIRLLISELKRLDPDSVIVGQAEALLAQMLEQDLADNGPDSANASAQKTLQSAAHTVALTKLDGP